MKCVITGGGGIVAQHACRGQRETLWSQFYPSTFMWVLGIKLRSPGFSGNTFICCPTCNPSTWESLSQIKSPGLTKVWEVILWYLFKGSVHTLSQSVYTLGLLAYRDSNTCTKRVCLSITVVAINSQYLDIIQMPSTEEWVCVV